MVKDCKRPLITVLLTTLLCALVAVLAFAFTPATQTAHAEGEGDISYHKCSECEGTGEYVAMLVDADGNEEPEFSYTTLEAAFKDAYDGETIKLLKCVSGLTSTITIGNDANDNRQLTFDLNGHTVQGRSDSYSMLFRLGTANINNGLKVHFKNGTIINAADTISDTNGNTYGVSVYGNTIAEFTDMHIEAGGNAIRFGSGNADKALIVNSGVYKSLKNLAIGSGNTSELGSNVNHFAFNGFADFYSYTATYAEPEYFGEYSDEGNIPATSTSISYEWQDAMFTADYFARGYSYEFSDISAINRNTPPAADFTLKCSIVKAQIKYFTSNGNNYVTLEDAIEAGCTSISLLDNVPATFEDEDGTEYPAVYTIPEGTAVELELANHSFNAKLVVNGNLTIKGTGNRWDDNIFAGELEKGDNGHITAQQWCYFQGNAVKYFADEQYSGMIELPSSAALVPGTSDGEPYYSLLQAYVSVNGVGYTSYNSAVQLGVREIVLDDDYEGELTVNIEDGRELVIDLNGHLWEGASNGDFYKVFTVNKGKVTIKNGTIQAAAGGISAPASPYAVDVAEDGELILEGVEVRGGDYGTVRYITNGALIRSSGKLVMRPYTDETRAVKNCVVRNTLIKSTNDDDISTDGSVGVLVSGGTAEFDGVQFTVGEVGIHITGGSVAIGGGTKASVYGTASNYENAGGIWLEDGNLEIGLSTLGLQTDFPIANYLADGVHAQQVRTYTTNGSVPMVDYDVVGHQYEATFNWNDNKTVCTVDFTCVLDTENKEEKITRNAEITSEFDFVDCNVGGTRTYTATVVFEGQEYTDQKTEAVAGGHTEAILVRALPTQMTYTAFDKLNTEGMQVDRYCLVCGNLLANNIPDTAYKIEHDDGDCLHYGDTSVAVVSGDARVTLSGLTVNKAAADVVWQWKAASGSEWANYTANTKLVYNGAAYQFRATFQAATGDANGSYTDTEVFATLDGNGIDSVVDAGTYALSFDTSVYVDYELSGAIFSVTVAPIDVQLSGATSKLLWQLTEGDADNVKYTNLRDGALYIYTDAQGKEIPSFSLLTTAGYTLKEVRNVTSSVIRYRNKAVSVGINPAAADGTYTFEYVKNSDYTTDGTNVGVYTAKAVLTPAKNYRFNPSVVSEIYLEGLSFEFNDDGTVTVCKTWYIVTMDNELLGVAASKEEKDWVDYSIDDWTFGDNVTVPMPRLAHGDEADDWANNELVSITLTLDSPLGEHTVTFNRKNFADYINASMPVGKYTLDMTVRETSATPNHIHWWNDEPADDDDGSIRYRAFTRTYSFEVFAADIVVSAAGEDGYASYTWELTPTADKTTFFTQFESAIASMITLKNTEKQGHWAESTVADYYSNGYDITYNLSRLHSVIYYAKNNSDFTANIVGGVNGTYTVYFDISTKNHNNLADLGSDSRYAYSFTVTVYETIDKPVVISDGLEYTGNKVLPEIVESELYETVWSETDAYITGGTHSVSFKLYDNAHYRWKGESGDTVAVEFTIAKANNDFTTALAMLGWNFETFDAAVNNIRAAAKYLDNGESIHFRVVKKDEATALDGLADFTVDGNGRVDETVAAVLNALKVGEYTLYAKVNGTGNYNQYERDIPFAVSKAMNSWADGDEDLVLPSWIVGKYDKKENAIVVNAAHGQVNIIIADINGKEYYNSTTGLNKLNDCEVGKYLLKAWVDETEDYAPLPERTFTIEVLEKVGLPWWATLLITVGALLVAALIIFILWKKGVFQILTEKIVVAIRTKASVDATIASVRAAKMMEEGKKSVAEAKRRERIEKMRQKAQENRALPPEERAARLEARAQEEAERAEQLRVKSETKLAKAAKMRGNDAKLEQAVDAEGETPEVETPETPTEE